jgi:NAD-dependent deacetylase
MDRERGRDRDRGAARQVSARARVVVLTGAGVSADSGLATFRGAGGLWEGHAIEDVATPEAWARDPARVWRFYQMRRASLQRAQPNAAHVALARLERELSARGVPFVLATQNVDDLHERAGSRPLHVHGELAVLACERCGGRVRDVTELDPERFVACGACGAPRLRPDVVWFGEIPLHLEEVERAVEACTLFAAIGTSGVVWPVAGWLGLARASGARTVVASLDAPENIDPADEFRPGRAAETVPRWVEEVLSEVAGE